MNALQAKIAESIERVVSKMIERQDLCVMQHGEWLGDARLEKLAVDISDEAAHDVMVALREKLS